jgi:hypothetical protein
VLREMRAGVYDEVRLDEQLASRGVMNRIFGRFIRSIREPWHMYPIGLLFGLGFDTATEVALLFMAAGAAGAGLPFYCVLCLPILFAAGMSLLDTIDGSFMNFAYGWAFSRPARKIFYNLTAAMSGLRQGELLALRWMEIDWLAQRIRVRRNFVRGQFGTPKSKRSSRSVPLADVVASELDALFKASAYTADEDLVFGHPHTGRPLDRSLLLKRFKRALKRAGVREVRSHDLRHTFGTRMAAAGVPMRTLQEWMGTAITRRRSSTPTTPRRRTRRNSSTRPSAAGASKRASN